MISALVPQSFSRRVAKCQPRTQASSRYLGDQRRLGTERDSASTNFSRRAWQATSHPKTPWTTGNEAGEMSAVFLRLPKWKISEYSLNSGSLKNIIVFLALTNRFKLFSQI